MFLNEPALDISFRVLHKGKSYMLYTSTGSLKSFSYGDIEHKKFICLHRVHEPVEAGPSRVRPVRQDGASYSQILPEGRTLTNTLWGIMY